MKSKAIFLVVQVVAWMVFIIFPAFIFSTIQPAFPNGYLNPALKGLVIAHLLLILFFYFNYYYAIPRFYFTRRYKTYCLILIGCLATILLVMETSNDFNPFYNSKIRYGHLIYLLSLKVRFIMILLLSLGISSYNRLKKIEAEKLKSELSYLKAQVNPHFLFNTLNSIYALSVKKSDAAPESITRLSAIMRYAITDAVSDFVSLDKEMNYVTSYIELEKLRLTSKVNLKYTVSGELAGKQIAPLIFIPFIENAFKYGVSTSDNSSITIAVSTTGSWLRLQVENTKAVKLPPRQHTRLGIGTTQKRLELLYPGKHTLAINDGENTFAVDLTLELS